MDSPRASIIVSSYNYERFLRVAIDSALAQTYPNTEVIVVDDGSRDGSPEVVKSYGDRVIPLLKSNGGQGSAFNEGFKLSRGEFVIFLDSDDYLEPDTVAKAAEFFRDPAVSKVHWNLWVGSAEGEATSSVVRTHLSEGDLREAVLHKGADGYMWPPTSGNAWARRFLEKVLPMPEREFNTCPDYYLATLAPLYGEVRAIQQPQGFWRFHPVNASFRDALDANISDSLGRAEQALNILERHARELGWSVDPQELRFNSRWHQMKAAVEQIERVIPAGEAFILVDEDHWKAGKVISGRPRFYFLEKEGEFWGLPADDGAAIEEVERLRGEGAKFLVIPWPYGWWLDHYKGFNAYMRAKFQVGFEDPRIVIFDLR